MAFPWVSFCPRNSRHDARWPLCHLAAMASSFHHVRDRPAPFRRGGTVGNLAVLPPTPDASGSTACRRPVEIAAQQTTRAAVAPRGLVWPAIRAPPPGSTGPRVRRRGWAAGNPASPCTRRSSTGPMPVTSSTSQMLISFVSVSGGFPPGLAGTAASDAVFHAVLHVLLHSHGRYRTSGKTCCADVRA